MFAGVLEWPSMQILYFIHIPRAVPHRDERTLTMFQEPSGDVSSAAQSLSGTMLFQGNL